MLTCSSISLLVLLAAPVCTTELGRAAQLKDQFAARNCKVVALSVDDASSHAGWIKDINEIVGCNVEFPIIGQRDKADCCNEGTTRPTTISLMFTLLTLSLPFLLPSVQPIPIVAFLACTAC